MRSKKNFKKGSKRQTLEDPPRSEDRLFKKKPTRDSYVSIKSNDKEPFLDSNFSNLEQKEYLKTKGTLHFKKQRQELCIFFACKSNRKPRKITKSARHSRVEVQFEARPGHHNLNKFQKAVLKKRLQSFGDVGPRRRQSTPVALP